MRFAPRLTRRTALTRCLPKLERLESREVPAITASLTQVANWQELGPNVIGGGQVRNITSPNPNGGADVENPAVGAIQALAPHPTDANIMFAAGPNGGVWRTANALDASPTWTPISDEVASLSVSHMAFDPANPNRLIVGIGATADGGEAEPGGTVRGDLVGVLITDNALAAIPSWRIANGGGALANRSVLKVAMTGNTILAATDSGMFRSTDGGLTFTNVLSSTINNGVTYQDRAFSSRVYDLAANPRLTTQFYIATEPFAGLPRQVWRTDDGGASWGTVTDSKMQLTDRTTSVKLSVRDAGALDNQVYVSVMNSFPANGPEQSLPGVGAVFGWENRANVLSSICWSTNQGGNWTRMDNPRRLTAPASLDMGQRTLVGDQFQGGGLQAVGGRILVVTSDVLRGRVFGDGHPHRLRNGDWVHIQGVFEDPLTVPPAAPPLDPIYDVNNGFNNFFEVEVLDDYRFFLLGVTPPGLGMNSTLATWQRVVDATPGEAGFLDIVAAPSNPALPNSQQNIVYLGGDFSQWRFDRFDTTSPGLNSPFPESFTGSVWQGNRFTVPTAPSVLNTARGLSNQWANLTDAGATGTAPGGDTREMVFDANGNLWVGTGTGVYHRGTAPGAPWVNAGGNIRVGQFWGVGFDVRNGVAVGSTQDTGMVEQVIGGGLGFSSVLPRTSSATDAQRNMMDEQQYAFEVAVDNTSTAGLPLDQQRTIRYYAGSAFGYIPLGYRTATSQTYLPRTFGGIVRQVYDAGGNLLAQDTLNLADALTNTIPLSGINPADIAFNNDSSARIVMELNANDARRGAYGLTRVYEDSDPLGPGSTPTTGLVVSDVTPVGMTGRVRSMAYGGKRAGLNLNQVMFVGTNDGQLWIRGEFGTQFTDTMGGTNPEYPTIGSGAVTDIQLDPDDYRRAFVVKGGQVYETRNLGVSWTLLSAGLVTAPDPLTGLPTGTGLTTQVYTIALFDPNPGTANVNDRGDVVLLAGGRGGVFRLNLATCGPNPIFTEYGTGLPNTVVTDLSVEGARLVAGTFGRGVWTIPDVTASLLTPIYLDVVGTAAPDNIYIESDPLDPFAIFIDDGTGFRQRFTSGQFEEIRIHGLGGADTLLIDSNGTAPGGTTGFLNVPVRVNMGNDAGDTIIVNNSTGTAPVQATVTSTSVGVGVLGGTDTIFNVCGLITYNGLDNGALVVNTGTGNDRILVGGGGPPLPRGLVLNGGNGDDTFDLIGPFTGGGTVILNDPSGNDSLNLSVPAGQVALVDSANNRVAVGGLNLITDGKIENLFLVGQAPGAVLQWFGTSGNDAVYLMQDPADPLNFSQILSGTSAVRFRGMTSVGIATGGGTDQVQVDSNGAAAGGTTAFVTYAVSVALGGDAGDTLIIDDSSNTAATRVDVSPSAVAGPFGGGVQVAYSGIAAGAILVLTGSGDDTIVFDASITTTGVVNAGGGGDDLWLIGTANDDTFTVAGSTVVANNLRLQPTFNVEQVVAAGQGGFDTLNTFGSVASENVTVQQSGPLSGAVIGFQLPVRFDSTEAVNIDAGAGGNALLWEDTSNTSFGAPRFAEQGVIFAPTGPYSGTVRVGQTGTATRFTNITGAFRMNGDPTGSNSRDVLTVLGASSTAAGATDGELLVDNGTDVITANDSGVQINNASIGLLRSVAFGNTPAGGASFSTVIVKGGNEIGTGDTVFAPTTNRLNLVLDGGNPALPPGDTLIAATAGAAAASLVDNPAFGPPQTRITDRGLGSSLGHLNFESVSVTIGGGGGPPALTPPSAQIFAVGSDAGFPANVRVYNANGTLRFNLAPFPGFTGGVRVAVGDVTGDGTPDVVAAAGAGGGPAVSVYDGKTGALVRTFFAFNSKFTGGVNVAVGFFDSDAFADIVVGAGPTGGPHVKVISGANGAELLSFFAFAPTTKTGVTVAAGDFTGSGQSDIVVGAGPGGGPAVKVFDGRTAAELHSFFAFPPEFSGGVTVAAGDITGDGIADVIAGAGPGGATQVLVHDGANLGAGPIRNFIVNDPNITGIPPINITSGVRVAASDLDGDGLADIVVGRGRGTRPFAQVLKVSSRAGGGTFEVFERLVAVNVFGDTYSNGIFVGS